MQEPSLFLAWTRDSQTVVPGASGTHSPKSLSEKRTWEEKGNCRVAQLSVSDKVSRGPSGCSSENPYLKRYEVIDCFSNQPKKGGS